MNPPTDTSLISLLDQLVSVGKISPEKKEETFTLLAKAASMRALGKLLPILTEEQRHLLQENTKSPEEIIGDILTAVPKEQATQILSQSAQEVVSEFLKQL